MPENERLEIRTYKQFGGTFTHILIDGQLVGYHKSDPILDSYHGGEVWRPAATATIKITPHWHEIFGHKACYLSDCIRAANDYIESNGTETGSDAPR